MQQTDMNIKPDQHEETDEINLLDLLLVLAKRWKMIIAVPIATAVITAIISLFMPNIYTAKTMIIPSESDSGGMAAALMSQIGGLAGLAGGLGGKTTTDLYVTMLKSERIKDPIIETYNLKERYKAKYRSDIYKTLDANSNISSGKKDGVISISFSDKDPKMAADIANSYVDLLGKLAVSLNVAGAGSNRQFLEKQLAKTKVDLNNAEESLKTFQSKNKALSVTDQAKATIEGVAQLRAQLATKEVELQVLQRQFTDNSQEVKLLKSAIASIKSQITALEGKGSGSSSIPNLGSVPQMGQDYLRLMREFKIQEAIYEMLTKQYELAQVSEAKDIAPFQILEKAKVPERKSKPKRSLIVILSTVTAGFIMVFTAFILEYLDKMSQEDRSRLNQIKGILPFGSKLRD